MPDNIEPTTVSRGPDGTVIGLCLSGGGLRAALYALGVVGYLAEADLLAQVQVVAAVSGGSLAAAVLADRWPQLAKEGFSVEAFQREVEQPFHHAVTEHNMRNAAISRWAVRRMTLRGRSRGSAMGDIMVKRLVSARRVIDLDPALQVVLTSTDLSTGRAFRVSRDFIGSYDFGYQAVPESLSLGQVVAASAAVPVLFPPQYLRTDGLGLKNAPEVLSLVDGGVYDNLGLEWFQGWDSGRPPSARKVDYIVVVDASGPMVVKPQRFGGVRAVNRGREVQYTQTRATRIRWFNEDLNAERMSGSYLIAKSDPCAFRLPDRAPIDPTFYDGALPPGFADALSLLRTDLDRFQPEEAKLLRYHGYWSAHARIASLHSLFGSPKPPRWREYADLGEQEAARLLDMLNDGRKRKLRR